MYMTQFSQSVSVVWHGACTPTTCQTNCGRKHNAKPIFEIAWGKDPGVSFRKARVSPIASLDFDDETRLIGEAACDWHGICNNAGCPTIVDWRAI